MKSLYRVTFADDSYEDIEAENSGEAKTAAKNARIQELDPSGQQSRGPERASLLAHPRVKVADVHERTEADQASARV